MYRSQANKERVAQTGAAGSNNNHIVFMFLQFVGLAHRSGPQRQFEYMDDPKRHAEPGAGTGKEI